MSEQNEITFFGETTYRNKCVRFGIKKDDRRRHMYLVGKTGMGKSTALENLMYSDIMSGHGVAVVDPHGDLVEKIVHYIPTSRINDVIYFNPGDLNYPIAFNVLETVNPEYQHLVASGMIGVFKKIWADSWGPRLEYVLRNAILALLDYPGSTLLGIMRLLVDKDYRKKVIPKIRDPVVRSFWVDEYSRYPDKFQIEAIAPIQNKVGQFLSNALIRNIVGQVQSSIDMRDIMDNKKILLMNLAKGRVGEDTSALLGAMMITKLQLAAMERIDIEEKKREDFYLYVDEFQNFATDSFANILSEARKYRLNLIIAHQYIEQLSEVVKPAVFGNVGTLACFRVGGADAEELVKEFTPRFEEEDLVNIPKWNVYLKLMIDGVASDPFSARILPPLTKEMETGNYEKIIRVSRERYAKPRTVIEEKIARWSGVFDDQKPMSPPQGARKKKEYSQPVHAPLVPAKPSAFAPAMHAPLSLDAPGPVGTSSPPEKKKKRKKKKNIPQGGGMQAQSATSSPPRPQPQAQERSTNVVQCHQCKKETTISFKPDGVRPVYCKECLKGVRSMKAKQQQRQPMPMNSGEIVERSQGQPKKISLSEAIQKKEPRQQTSREERRPQPPSFPQHQPQASPSPRVAHANPVHTVRPGEVVRFPSS